MYGEADYNCIYYKLWENGKEIIYVCVCLTVIEYVCELI